MTSPPDLDTRPERTLHLLDIENLVGSPAADETAVRRVIEEYRAVVGIGPGDLVVVAVGDRMLFDAAKAIPGARLLLGRGKDGADRALIFDATVEAIAARVHRVAVGSGGHIFAAFIVRLRLAGVETIAVARQGSASRHTVSHADERRWIGASHAAAA